MATDPPIAILEVGTTRTVCLVGRAPTQDQPLRLLGCGVSPSTGVRKGEVTDLSYAASSVRAAMDQASEAARCDLRSVRLIFSGGDTQSLPAKGRIVLSARDPTVDAEDLDEVRELARAEPIPENRTLMHSVLRNYRLDDNRVVLNAEGLPAQQLQANMLLIHTATSSLRAMLSAVEDAQVEVIDTVFSALCAGMATLSREQKRAGVLLVHLGGGSTTYLAYADETVAAAGSIPVGGDHTTNDIMQAFHLTGVKTAEWLKIDQGSAVLDQTAPSARASIPANASLGSTERSFSLRALHTVINARCDELFNILRRFMDSLGVLPKLGAGVVLTGGGAYQRGITQLAGRIFEAPCAIGTLPPLDGIRDDQQPAAFAAVYGGLVLAARDMADTAARRPKRRWGLRARSASTSTRSTP